MTSALSVRQRPAFEPPPSADGWRAGAAGLDGGHGSREPHFQRPLWSGRKNRDTWIVPAITRGWLGRAGRSGRQARPGAARRAGTDGKGGGRERRGPDLVLYIPARPPGAATPTWRRHGAEEPRATPGWPPPEPPPPRSRAISLTRRRATPRDASTIPLYFTASLLAASRFVRSFPKRSGRGVKGGAGRAAWRSAAFYVKAHCTQPG